MDWEMIGKIILLAIILFAVGLVYFIPSLVANKKGHKLLIAVIAVNFF